MFILGTLADPWAPEAGDIGMNSEILGAGPHDQANRQWYDSKSNGTKSKSAWSQDPELPARHLLITGSHNGEVGLRLPGRCGNNRVQDTEEPAPVCYQGKASLPHEVDRFTGPLAGKSAPMARGHALLQPGDYR